MSVFDRLASSLGRNDEVPNQELAQDIIETENQGAIDELISLLLVHSTEINNDSIKTLYEIAYVKPDLIKAYARDFIYHIHSTNTRLVWGVMIALSTIARLEADLLFSFKDDIIRVMNSGSVICTEAGIRILAGIAVSDNNYREILFPTLIKYLLTCRAKDVPQYSEQIFPAVDTSHSQSFQDALEARLSDLSESQRKRVKKVLSYLA